MVIQPSASKARFQRRQGEFHKATANYFGRTLINDFHTRRPLNPPDKHTAHAAGPTAGEQIAHTKQDQTAPPRSTSQMLTLPASPRPPR